MTQRASDRVSDQSSGPRPCVTCGAARRDHRSGTSTVTLHSDDGSDCIESRQCAGYVPPARGTVLMGARG